MVLQGPPSTGQSPAEDTSPSRAGAPAVRPALRLDASSQQRRPFSPCRPGRLFTRLALPHGRQDQRRAGPQPGALGRFLHGSRCSMSPEPRQKRPRPAVSPDIFHSAPRSAHGASLSETMPSVTLRGHLEPASAPRGQR